MSETPQEFDLVVIGGGPAGIVGATTAATFGKTVAVVDSHHELGGAGANTGTVPSKLWDRPGVGHNRKEQGRWSGMMAEAAGGDS